MRPELGFAYIVSVALWMAGTFGYYRQNGRLSIFVAALLVFTVFAVVCVWGFERLGKIIEQLAVLLVYAVILSVAIMLSDKTNIGFEYHLVYVVFSLLPFAFFAIAGCLIKIINKPSVFVSWICRNKFALLVIAAAILVRLPYIEMMQRWDAGEYYWRFSQAVKGFEFIDFDEYMGSFCLCGHPTMMFSLVYMAGELLLPEKIIGASITSYVLTAVALWCVYRIILKCVKGTGEKKAAAYTALVSFAPLFYGTATYFNPDYAMACFFLITLYAFIYEKSLIAGVAALCCFQTKETGIVIVFGLVVGTFIRHIIAKNEKKGAIKRIATDGCLYTTLVATVLQLMYMSNIGGVSNWTQTGEDTPGLVWNSAGNNCLGFNVPYIATKLKQQFVLNFNWIFTLLIIIGIIALVVHRVRNGRAKERSGYVWCLIASLIAFVIFSCIYITSPMARYNVVGDVLLYMVAIYVVEKVTKTAGINAIPVRIAQSVAAVLVVAECFITIDPLTLVSFKMLNTGAATMCYTGHKYQADEDMYYGDYLVYNTQYMYIDRAYDAILAEAGYDASWDILLPSSNGNALSGNMYRLNWDSKRGKRVFYTNENTAQMKWFIEGSASLAKEVSSLTDKAILVVNPYYRGVDNDGMIEEALKYYNCVQQGTYSSLQGEIYYYVMERK